ncbi:MAG: BhlA/UviB family holin-like peptide [Firmicutes bacterium]|nr:BhlA/UviB family holin-like peptide [Bacillota bacterium]
MDMTLEILSAALNSGLFAALFCFLFIFQIRDSREREKKFTKTIDALLEGLRGINMVDEKCGDIHGEVKLIRADCKDIKSICSEIKKSVNIRRAKEKKEGAINEF